MPVIVTDASASSGKVTVTNTATGQSETVSKTPEAIRDAVRHTSTAK